ncbi:NUDIX domain-containing protein [Paenibacillus radicis (ex Xue et al. 2023)]|uniref:NUDIX hydrolase n=1 Tax=Paenibacillus radicis (ex Xue et al. 2023) TaxID=2972489 RepID=A0ABT1YGL6_9BACL|nr:NUDIX hydrolase [Paenibacillus radicis (ex Xue et al. 2023)]MCR8632097.1 NUDIX hydrolase [Paenibacillus radicis (ex Xue et al. 2023)]
MNGERPRAFGAIIKDNDILMVQEVYKDREFWTLPGGGLENGETFEQAVIREVKEEVNLSCRVVKFLFTHRYTGGTENCYLLELIDEDELPSLGFDPELPVDKQTLSDVRWRSINELKDDLHVSKVIEALSLKVT